MGETVSTLFTQSPELPKPLNRLLVCPDCFRGIPLFTLDHQNYQLSYTTPQCKCHIVDPQTMSIHAYITKLITTKPPVEYCATCLTLSQKNSPGARYCMDCSEWFCRDCLYETHADALEHSLFDDQVTLFCIDHQQAYAYYCKTCKLSLCLQCKAEGYALHKNHEVILLKQIDYKKFKLNYTQAIEAKSKSMIVNEENKEHIQGLTNFMSCLFYTIHHTGEYLTYEMISICSDIHEDLGLKNYLYQEEVKFKNKQYQCTAKLPYHGAIIMQLRNGEILLTDDDTNRIYILDPHNYKVLYILEGFESRIIKVIELTNGNLACKDDYNLSYWKKTNDGIYIPANNPATSLYYITQMVEFPSNYLALIGDGLHIKIWSSKSEKTIASLTEHNITCDGLLLLCNGNLLSYDRNNTMKIWSKEPPFNCLMTLWKWKDHISTVTNLSETLFASAGYFHNYIRIWDLTKKTYVHEYQAHKRQVDQLTQLSKRLFASSGNDMKIKVWRINTWKCVITVEYKTNLRTVLEVDDDMLLSINDKPYFDTYSLVTGKLLQSTNYDYYDGSLKYLKGLELTNGAVLTSGVVGIRIWNNWSSR